MLADFVQEICRELDIGDGARQGQGSPPTS
jgi:hypothetical protein